MRADSPTCWPQVHQLLIASVPGGSSVAQVVGAGMGIVQRPISQYPYLLQGTDGYRDRLASTVGWGVHRDWVGVGLQVSGKACLSVCG